MDDTLCPSIWHACPQTLTARVPRGSGPVRCGISHPAPELSPLNGLGLVLGSTAPAPGAGRRAPSESRPSLSASLERLSVTSGAPAGGLCPAQLSWWLHVGSALSLCGSLSPLRPPQLSLILSVFFAENVLRLPLEVNLSLRHSTARRRFSPSSPEETPSHPAHRGPLLKDPPTPRPGMQPLG